MRMLGQGRALTHQIRLLSSEFHWKTCGDDDGSGGGDGCGGGDDKSYGGCGGY